MLVRCNYNSKRGNRFSEERDRKGRVIRPGDQAAELPL